ncbi:uncharacterized protein LOC132194924 [Neocloeon triangulifer]|uniref:uncharacterized protein LOC132194924 n=1 Tax=Neocloeon triangulifer TaxID=2078957 RepID=UPI00286F66D9|nr:uncharacterized protein LOC132194924 [Neocloeon triangulifer]
MESPKQAFLSASEVQTALQKAVGPNATLKGYTLKPVSQKVGFMGEHFNVLVEYQESRISYQTSFFVKRVPDAKLLRDFISKFGLFAKEREMYEKLLPMMCKALKVSKLPVPDCFIISDENYLLFEDLLRAGYKLRDKNQYLEMADCKALIEAVAQLHAGSVAIEAKTGKMMAFHMRNYDKVGKANEKSDDLDIAASWHAASLASTLGLILKMDEFKNRVAQVPKEKLLLKLSKAWDDGAEMASGFSSKFANVLSHGDLWLNNMLFKDDPSGQVKATLIDFQTYKYAPPVLDILSFLHLNASRKFRQNHQSELLKFYHSTLVKILLKANVNPDLAPSLEELEKSAFDLRLAGIFIAVKYMPTALKTEVTPAEQHLSAAERDGIPQEYIRDSSDLIIQSFGSSPTMKTRMTEAIEENPNKYIKVQPQDNNFQTMRNSSAVAMESPKQAFLSASEVQTALQKAVGPNATLKGYTLKPINGGERVGYFGEHLIVQVQYQESRISHQTSFFVKRVPEANSFRSFISKFGIFAKEREIYEKLLPMMCDALKIMKLPAPDCLIICDDQYLVFEDLLRAGYKMRDKNEYLKLADCKALIEAVAQLHAGSVAIEAKTGKIMAFHMKNHHEVLFVKEKRADLDIAASWHAVSLASTLGLILKMDEFKDKVAQVPKEKLSQKLSKAWDDSAEMASGFSAKFTNVLSHGDLWLNNMLFKNEPSGQVKATLVDFQNYRYAPPVLDILSFLHLTTSRKFRQNHQSELLKFYHSTLVKILLKANVNPDLAPSLEELEKSAFSLRLFGIVIAVRYMPTALKTEFTPAEQQLSAAEKDGIPQEYIRDSSDLIIRSFGSSPTMKTRMTEAIEELIDFLDL